MNHWKAFRSVKTFPSVVVFTTTGSATERDGADELWGMDDREHVQEQSWIRPLPTVCSGRHVMQTDNLDVNLRADVKNEN